jgi:abortive infection bacteriophage resistance protein
MNAGYAKPPLALDQQIALLKERGLCVPDEAVARHWLLHVNYYRLRAYWLPLEDAAAHPQHRFIAGTSFDQVVAAYEFDRELRLLLLDAVERIETSVRTQWAYQLAMRHGAFAHEESGLYRDVARHAKRLAMLEAEYRNSDETFAAHHRQRYPSLRLPPLWVACELLTLGQLSRWIADLRAASDRQAMADAYALDETVFTSFLHRLSIIRNLSAHHGRLWNRGFNVRMKLPRKKPATVAEAMNVAEPDRLYNALVLMAHALRQVSPGTHWPQRLRGLVARAPQPPERAMGFPAGWAGLAFWSEQP